MRDHNLPDIWANPLGSNQMVPLEDISTETIDHKETSRQFKSVTDKPVENKQFAGTELEVKPLDPPTPMNLQHQLLDALGIDATNVSKATIDITPEGVSATVTRSHFTASDHISEKLLDIKIQKYKYEVIKDGVNAPSESAPEESKPLDIYDLGINIDTSVLQSALESLSMPGEGNTDRWRKWLDGSYFQPPQPEASFVPHSDTCAFETITLVSQVSQEAAYFSDEPNEIHLQHDGLCTLMVKCPLHMFEHTKLVCSNVFNLMIDGRPIAFSHYEIIQRPHGKIELVFDLKQERAELLEALKKPKHTW